MMQVTTCPIKFTYGAYYGEIRVCQFGKACRIVIIRIWWRGSLSQRFWQGHWLGWGNWQKCRCRNLVGRHRLFSLKTWGVHVSFAWQQKINKVKGEKKILVSCKQFNLPKVQTYGWIMWERHCSPGFAIFNMLSSTMFLMWQAKKFPIISLYTVCFVFLQAL
jgi:hypothetical protein